MRRVILLWIITKLLQVPFWPNIEWFNITRIPSGKCPEIFDLLYDNWIATDMKAVSAIFASLSKKFEIHFTLNIICGVIDKPHSDYLFLEKTK